MFRTRMEVMQSSSSPTEAAGWRGVAVRMLQSCRDSSNGRLVSAILLAQILSVALATTGVSSQALTNQGVYAPTTQAFLNYCLLAVVFGCCSLAMPALRQTPTAKPPNSSINSSSPTNWARIRRSWPSFAALALIDVEANVLVTKAYQYTSLTSVTLLDCFTIPCVMLLSWLILRARYRPGHFIGAACCIAGLAVLVLGDSQGTAGANRGVGSALGRAESDSPPRLLLQLLQPSNAAAATGTGGSMHNSNDGSSGSAPLLGDCLVLLGALLYGVCNVTQELLLADVEPGTLLALLGIFGALISGVQAAALEHSMLRSMAWTSPSVFLPLLGFAAAMFAFYSLVPQVLLLGGATVLNLSLLSSDAWAALARFLWFGGFQGWSAYFFIGSLLLVAGGLVVFTLNGSPKDSSSEGACQGQGAGGDGGRVRQAGVAASNAPTVGEGVSYTRIDIVGDEEDQHGHRFETGSLTAS